MSLKGTDGRDTRKTGTARTMSGGRLVVDYGMMNEPQWCSLLKDPRMLEKIHDWRCSGTDCSNHSLATLESVDAIVIMGDTEGWIRADPRCQLLQGMDSIQVKTRSR